MKLKVLFLLSLFCGIYHIHSANPDNNKNQPVTFVMIPLTKPEHLQKFGQDSRVPEPFRTACQAKLEELQEQENNAKKSD